MSLPLFLNEILTLRRIYHLRARYVCAPCIDCYSSLLTPALAIAIAYLSFWQRDEICLSHYELIDEEVQKEQISRLKVLAGHFMWGEMLLLL